MDIKMYNLTPKVLIPNLHRFSTLIKHDGNYLFSIDQQFHQICVN